MVVVVGAAVVVVVIVGGSESRKFVEEHKMKQSKPPRPRIVTEKCTLIKVKRQSKSIIPQYPCEVIA